MTQKDAETLAQLVDDRAGKGKEFTFEVLAQRSVDPETGYTPSPNLVWKVASGQDVKINRPLVRALAAGLSYPLARVQRAAAFQYTGYVATDVSGGAVVHERGAEPGGRARSVLDRWAEEESPDRGNHSPA